MLFEVSFQHTVAEDHLALRDAFDALRL